MRAYQWTNRPVIGANCRFFPSCSDYAIEAIRGHGAVRGSGLAARRILRCNPWHEGGYDPVPCLRLPDEGVMDQKRLFIAIAISVAILLGFQVLIAPHLPQPPKPPPQVASRETTPTQGLRRARPAPARRRGHGADVPKEVPRLKIAAPRVRGSDQPARRAAG